MRISVILPVYNGGLFILESASRLEEFLFSRFKEFEIIFINDGSKDNTAKQLTQIRSSNIKVLELKENQGKFAAIKAGVKEAKGECILFTDADLPYDLEAISYMEHLVNLRYFHVVIGDRTLPGSQYRELLPFLRRCCTSFFSHSVRLLVYRELLDTQCGLKAFRVDVAKEIFPLLSCNRFAADVELLYIALKYNLALRRIPVRLQRQGLSTVRSIKDGFQMLFTVATLRYNWISGKYKSETLFNLGKQYYWNR